MQRTDKRRWPQVQFEVGDLIAVIDSDPVRTGSVLQVDTARQMLRVQALRPREVIEVPFQQADLVGREEEPARRPARDPHFEQGTVVRVIDGEFAEMEAIVQEVLPRTRRLRVNVLVFGRTTEAELGYSQVEVR
jgi:transcription antitermination factor NusG